MKNKIKKDLLQYAMTLEELENNLLPNEVFVKMDTTLYPEIKKDRYMISNKGRVYSLVERRFLALQLPKTEKSSVSYFCVWLGDKKYLVHRLMMASFEHLGDVQKMRSLFIDHKDGNKHHNELYNLRWATTKENVQFALEQGLFNPRKGETHPCASITDEQARTICELLSTGKYSQHQIAEMISCEDATVFNIAHGKTWKHISKDYNVDNKLLKKYPKCFTYDQVYDLCKYFQESPKDKDMSVRKYCKNALLGINYDENIISEGILNGVRSIYKRERYGEITKEFIW